MRINRSVAVLPRRVPFTLLALPLALWACGPDAIDGVDAATSSDSGNGGEGCLGGPGWSVEAVTTTPGTATHHGDIAFTASGRMWIAFADPQSGTSSNQDVFTTQLDSCTWSTPEVRHAASTYQFAYPSLVASGETLHLAFNGLFDETTQNNDIYYAKNEGGTWTSATAITTTPTGPGVGAFEPVLATSSSGGVAVAFLFGGDTATIDTEVRVGSIVGGHLQGQVTVMSGVVGGCDAPQLVFDKTGTRHVVAACGNVGDARVYYTNDAGGSFAPPVSIDDSADVYNAVPQLAIAPDGSTLHVAWFRNQSCSAGLCGEIVYASRKAGFWSTPVNVNGGSDTREAFPTVAVSPSGTVYIAYERDNSAKKSDIFVATSTDGATFAESIVTPGTDGSSETLSGSMYFNPTTGRPHFTFAKVLGGDPFNMEVWHAELNGGTVL